MPSHHLAQINIARMLAPIDDPLMAEFVAQLPNINALAEKSPGFVWRLQTETGDATSIKVYVSAPTTLKKYKNGYYVSPIFPRWSMEKWLDAGQPHAQKWLKDYSVEFLKTLPVPEDHDELIGKGEEFIAEWEKSR